MNVSVTGKHVELTEPMKNSALGGMESLKKYNLDIISANAIITGIHGGKTFNVEFTVNVAHKDTVVIHEEHDDVYAAIDIVTQRTQKSLRRYHDKLVDHKAEKPSFEEENEEE
ncbi:MAG: 30S ribosomal protein S30 [uncultured Campylobacterales bacterium]|uniref:30S ribosomal protein S30 n=1 Tax=uncultured Campylobacterales bacterium TaxID=352960 RepID=A0A6S6SDV0_9BACT|nr:MAG: 30S ribosomal protein S30 [uncultured Campylobacterales bacterium]